jgi:hypothetical protein
MKQTKQNWLLGEVPLPHMLSTVDRIALAAIFSVAILILVTFELTGKSAMQPMPAAATVSMSSYLAWLCPNLTTACRQ